MTPMIHSGAEGESGKYKINDNIDVSTSKYVNTQSHVPLCSGLTSHSKQGLVVRFIVISPGTDKVPTLPSDSMS